MPRPLRRSWKIAITTIGLLLLLGTANAAAATRFAAPGGVAPASSECTREAPCSLFSAASAVAPNSALRVGDEVVVLPGTYSAPGDLGSSSTFVFLNGIQVHGLAGEPHPLILVGGGIDRPLLITPGDVVSDLEVESGSTGAAVRMVGAVLDGVVVRDSADRSVACNQEGGALLDSACLDTGVRGTALASNPSAGGSGPLKLRNVTAIARGQDSFGLQFGAFGGTQLSVDAKSVIAEGQRSDIAATALGAGSNLTVDLENSDFGSREVRVEQGGTASITAPGSGANIIEPPQLAGDGYHELPSSPTVDKGVLDASSGTADVDGEARTIGIAPDIGADELGRDAVDTSLSCLPSAVEINQASTCTITVKDAVNALSQPEGEVRFASNRKGNFTPAGGCELEGVAPDEASCHLTYTPERGGEHAITAIYQGDEDRNSGSAVTRVNVASHPTAISLNCTPSALVAGKVSTCVALVVDPKADPVQPEGEVRFSHDRMGGFIPGAGTCELEGISAGEASCHVAYKPAEAGEHTITAAYRGDDSHNSGSASTQVTAAPRPPSAVSFNCTPSAVIVGEPSTCAVAVFNLDPGDADQPGGEVHFSRDHRGAFTPASATCELEGISPGEAGCHVTYTPTERGQHLITAEYRGDDNHDSGEAPTQVTVTARPSATTVLCAPASVPAGEGSICTVSLRDTQANPIQPEGEVHFESDHGGDFTPASANCELEGVASDEARCQVSYTPTASGEHLITGTYEGDDNHDSGSGSARVTVAAHPSATTLVCTSPDVVAGEGSSCTVSVRDPSPADSIQPEGEVRFASNRNGNFTPASASCELEGVAPDEASCRLTYTPSENGTHKITASFSGDQSHDSSGGSTQVKAAPHPSTTALACAPSSLVLGSGAAACTVIVTDSAANPKAASGVVKFASSGRGAFGNGGSCALADAKGDKASCQVLYTPSAAGAAAHKVTASYGGDIAHEKSEGQALVEVTEATRPVAPNTKFKKKPRKRTFRRRARFTFVSDQANSSFKCKLDRKPFRPCRSPFKKRLKPGRHVFKVRAINPAGISDPTPALYKWRVGRARR